MPNRVYFSSDDWLQIQAFKAVFKTADGSPAERLVTAVLATCDTAYAVAKAQRPQLCERYHARRAQTRRGRGRGSDRTHRIAD